MIYSCSKKRLKPPKCRKQLTPFDKGQIVAWFADHVSNRQIAKRLKRDHRTIDRFLKLYKDTRSYARAGVTGVKRKTTEREDRLIVRQALKKRKITVDSCFVFFLRSPLELVFYREFAFEKGHFR